MYSETKELMLLKRQLAHIVKHINSIVEMINKPRTYYDIRVQMNALCGNAEYAQTLFTEWLRYESICRTNNFLTTPYLDKDTIDKLLLFRQVLTKLDSKNLVEMLMFLDSHKNNRP